MRGYYSGQATPTPPHENGSGGGGSGVGRDGKGDEELEPFGTGNWELGPASMPTGPGGTGAGDGTRDQGAAPAARGRRSASRLVLERLQELAVSLRLVPPHHCDPPQHLTYRMNVSSGCCSSFHLLLQSRWPHVGLQCDRIRCRHP